MRLSELDPKLSDTGAFPDSLTVNPSVNAGCWHGWIKNGEVLGA